MDRLQTCGKFHLNLLYKFDTNLSNEYENYQIPILNDWIILWYKYICGVLKYFNDHNLMDRLLVFDVEQDEIDKLIQFFAGFDFDLDATHWKKLRPTYPTKKWAKKWEDILLEYPKFRDTEKIEYTNIDKHCDLDQDFLRNE